MPMLHVVIFLVNIILICAEKVKTQETSQREVMDTLYVSCILSLYSRKIIIHKFT